MWKRLVRARCLAREVPHPKLNPDDGEPKCPGRKVQDEAEADPAAKQREACEVSQCCPGHRLQQHCHCGEARICDNDNPGGMCNQGRVACPMGHQHEESNAGTSAEEDGGPDHMNEFQSGKEIHQRSSRSASAVIANSMAGMTLRNGPRG